MLAAILVSLFVVGADPAGLVPTASVGASGVTYRYYMDVVSPRTTLCLGEKVGYKVVVFRTSDTDEADAFRVTSVKVEAYADDPSIGKFTRAKGGIAVDYTALGADTPTFDVEFTFAAGKKIGSTTLQFQGLVPGISPLSRGYVSFAVPIRVIPCKYKVSTIVRFPLYSGFNSDIVEPPIVAKMKSTLLTSDADGNFTGTGKLHWIATSFRSGCLASQKFTGDTNVALSGMIFDGHLQLRMIYEPGNGALTINCGPAGQTSIPRDPVQLDQLDVEMPMSGGSLMHTQAHTQGSLPGKVRVSAILVTS